MTTLLVRTHRVGGINVWNRVYGHPSRAAAMQCFSCHVHKPEMTHNYPIKRHSVLHVLQNQYKVLINVFH